MAALLRPDNAGSNTASDYIITSRLALAQLPKALRRGRRTLMRTDCAGGTQVFSTGFPAGAGGCRIPSE